MKNSQIDRATILSKLSQFADLTDMDTIFDDIEGQALSDGQY